MTNAIPRGIRNNNPGNIEKGASKWQGLAGNQSDSRFATFTDATWGIRALAVLLINYQDKYGLNTIEGIINRWAPPVENKTSAYVIDVVAAVKTLVPNTTKNKAIDLHNHDYLFGIVSGIIRHENGAGPEKTLNQWYKDDVVNEALRRAGVVQEKKKVVTTTTVAAGATAVGGIDQLAGVIPQVTSAITNSRDDLTSGEWVRIAIGVVMVGAAIALAYSHWRRQKLATA